MPPTPVRRPISKDRFSAIFSTAKSQTYYDPSSRGPGSHTIRSIAWNNTGSFIATGGADRLVRIWNPERANVKNSTELRGHGLGVERVAWDPTKDGGLASVSGDGSVKFWDVRSAKCLGEVKTGGENFTLAWHPEGTAVAVGRKVIARSAAIITQAMSYLTIHPSKRMTTSSSSTLEPTPPSTLSKNQSRPTN
jgi:THO complex subunit 3